MDSQISRMTHRSIKVVGVLSLALASALAMAQSSSFPNRLIKIIVPYSAGSGSDVLARTIGQSVSEKAHQAVVIENREGGGSLVGTLEAAKAAPDGYTLLIVANPFVINPSQKAKPPYNPVTDFVPIMTPSWAMRSNALARLPPAGDIGSTMRGSSCSVFWHC